MNVRIFLLYGGVQRMLMRRDTVVLTPYNPRDEPITLDFSE